MASTARRRYLFAYDIRDPKRLRAVHKIAQGYGWAMQYSLFVGDLDPIELIDLKRSITAVIDHRKDSVVLIDVGSPGERRASSFHFIGLTPALPTVGPTII